MEVLIESIHKDEACITVVFQVSFEYPGRASFARAFTAHVPYDRIHLGLPPTKVVDMAWKQVQETVLAYGVYYPSLDFSGLAGSKYVPGRT